MVSALLVDGTGRLLAGASEGAEGSGIYCSVDRGATWTRSAFKGWVYAFAEVPGGFIAGTGSGVYRTTDGGSTWGPTAFTLPAYAVARDSSGALLAGTSGYTVFGTNGLPAQTAGAHAGAIYRSTDGGLSWQEVFGSSATVSGLLVSAPGTAYAALAGQGVVRSTDGGATWGALNGGLPSGAVCLVREESGSILAGTPSGMLARLASGASTWEAVLSFPGAGASILALATDAGAILAGTDAIEGFLLLSTDRGATWSRNEGALAARWILALRATRSGVLLAGTLDGLFLTTDEGATWRRAAGQAGSSTVYALEETILGTLVAAAGYDGVFTSSDQGLSWSHNTTLPPGYYSRIAVSPSGALFAGGSFAVQRSTDGGASWSSLEVTGGGLVFGSRTGAIFLRDSAGGVQRSSDDGRTWKAALNIDPAVYSMAEDSSGVLYAGTHNGVFFSADSGATWKEQASREAWCLAANAAGYLFRGDYGDFELEGPMLSKNGGTSWSDIGSGLGAHAGITCYSILPSGRVFAGTVDGCVFRSAVSSLPALLSSLACAPAPGRGVSIDWVTAEENGLQAFVVERSPCSGGAFAPLAGSTITARGIPGKASSYSYTDTSAVPGILYTYRLRQVGRDGDVSYSQSLQLSVATGIAESTPLEFTLSQNYPNPFNPSTVVRYTLPRAGNVRLEVFNTLGQLVSALVDGVEGQGVHEARFDAGRLASGVYLYRLSAGSSVAVRRMLLVK
jgi:photosystem II stability/assembly factor-like uncharacterized protein